MYVTGSNKATPAGQSILHKGSHSTSYHSSLRYFVQESLRAKPNWALAVCANTAGGAGNMRSVVRSEREQKNWSQVEKVRAWTANLSHEVLRKSQTSAKRKEGLMPTSDYALDGHNYQWPLFPPELVREFFLSAIFCPESTAIASRAKRSTNLQWFIIFRTSRPTAPTRNCYAHKFQKSKPSLQIWKTCPAAREACGTGDYG